MSFSLHKVYTYKAQERMLLTEMSPVDSVIKGGYMCIKNRVAQAA